jgi:hypothetical protein
MNIFADHSDIIIDPFGVNRGSDMYGICISPRQSPVYQLMVRRILIFQQNQILFLFSQFMVQH